MTKDKIDKLYFKFSEERNVDGMEIAIECLSLMEHNIQLLRLLGKDKHNDEVPQDNSVAGRTRSEPPHTIDKGGLNIS